MNFSVTFFMGFVSLAAAAKAPKLWCSSRELERRDCRLTSGTYNYRILNQTIAGSDGTWHSVNPMPLFGDGIEWEKVQFKILEQLPILQLWLWDKGVGESQVQSLRWFVVSLEHQHFAVLAEGVVRKRRLKPTPSEGEVQAAKIVEGASLKPSYLYDKMEDHGLKASKDGFLLWHLGKEKKTLEKVKHGV